MISNTMQEDRRAHTRYKVRDGAYAALSPNSAKMGQIIDISRGGLCFRYIVQMDQANKTGETHIFVGDEGIYLEKMPHSLIEDIPVDNNALSGSFITGNRPMRVMRQRRIKFGNLTGNQVAQLEYFIMNRTAGRA